MNASSVTESTTDPSTTPSSSQEKIRFRSCTEQSGNQLIINAAVESRVPMDEGGYTAERRRLIVSNRKFHYWALQAEERCRRQKEESEEIRREASKQLQLKDQHIAELTKRLNDLQHQPDILDDDEVIRSMAKLSQQLDVWVKGSFKDPQLLENLPQMELVDMPYSLGTTNKLQNAHQKWAFIRSFVASYLSFLFFDAYMVGLTDPGYADCLSTIESAISSKCPAHVADNWRSATSTAIQSLAEGYLEAAGMACIQGVEQFASCAPSDPGLRKKKLCKLLRGCVDFKRRLERQPARYEFSHTPSGDRFMSGTMQSVRGEEGDGAVVQFLLWPGLWKGDLVLYPETVWSTMDEASAKNSDAGTDTTPIPHDEAGVCN